MRAWKFSLPLYTADILFTSELQEDSVRLVYVFQFAPVEISFAKSAVPYFLDACNRYIYFFFPESCTIAAFKLYFSKSNVILGLSVVS